MTFSIEVLNDNQAASKPIGVILMILIVIVLASLIVGFTSGFSPSEPAPTTTFNVETQSTGSGDIVSITHNGGDTVDPENIEVTYDGETETWDQGSAVTPPNKVTVGSEYTVEQADSESELSVTYISDDKQNSVELKEGTIPASTSGGSNVPSLTMDFREDGSTYIIEHIGGDSVQAGKLEIDQESMFATSTKSWTEESSKDPSDLVSNGDTYSPSVADSGELTITVYFVPDDGSGRVQIAQGIINEGESAIL